MHIQSITLLHYAVFRNKQFLLLFQVKVSVVDEILNIKENLIRLKVCILVCWCGQFIREGHLSF